MYGYDDIPTDCPFEWFWIVTQRGLVKRAKAYKVADAFPDLTLREKYDYLGLLGTDVDYSNPWYLVPDGPYRTTRRFLSETAAEAALAALERWRKVQKTQDAILDSVDEALAVPPRGP